MILSLKYFLVKSQPDRIIECKLTDAARTADKLRGVTTVVTSQQQNTTRRLPSGMSQSGLGESSGIRLPARSAVLELQTVGRGGRVGSATENCPSESMSHSGSAGDVW